VRPLVWSTDTGDKLNLQLRDAGMTTTLAVEPRYEEGAPFPLLGFAPPTSLTLFHHPRDKSPPYRSGSAASKAEPPLFGGDRVVGMTDPTKANGDFSDLGGTTDSFVLFDYEARMAKLAGKPVTLYVKRGDTAEKIVVPAEVRRETGLRMRMGPVSAIRAGSPAATAGLQAKDATNQGDRIVEVEAAAAGAITLFTNDVETAKARKSVNLKVEPLDPLRLPWLLHQWRLQKDRGNSVKVTVLRGVEHSEKRVTLEIAWDDRSAADIGDVASATTPVPINGLGLAYQVQAVVDAVAAGSSAATVGVQPGDTIEAVKFVTLDEDQQVKTGSWQDVKPHQWAYVDRVMQQNAPHELVMRFNRAGVTGEVKVTGTPDATCPVIDRGLIFMPEYRVQKAESIPEALGMGVNRTIRMVKSMYINLYAMVFGRVSAIQTMSGPITLARLSYRIAGESTYKLLLLLALISINLAVVNFLPIPVLDGGHMMFLIYEGLIGKPPPERIHYYLTILGFCCVVALMLFVIGLDIWRLVKVWMGW
jgi:regulator of sigma E protease